MFDHLSFHSSETVTVVAVIKTGFDVDPRRSSPTTICGGCTVTVLIEEIQPPATQTAEQKQYMISLMSHPDYLEVEYASESSGSLTTLESTLYYAVGITVAIALIAFVSFVLAKRRVPPVRKQYDASHSFFAGFGVSSSSAVSSLTRVSTN